MLVPVHTERDCIYDEMLNGCKTELIKDQNEEYEVVILEETQEIGGISRTVRYNGNRMDIGGHRFFSKDQKVMDFWEELMPIQGVNSFDDEKLGRVKAELAKMQTKSIENYTAEVKKNTTSSYANATGRHYSTEKISSSVSTDKSLNTNLTGI